MWALYLYPVFFAYLIYRYRKEKSYIFFALTGLYLFSSVTALYLVHNSYDFMSRIFPIWAVGYHLLMISLVLLPARRIDEFSGKELEYSDYGIVRAFSYFIIVVTLLYMWYCIKDLDLKEVLYDAAYVRNTSDHSGGEFGNKSFMSYVRLFACQFNAVPLALAFYYMKFFSSKKITIFLLLICSFSSPITLLYVSSRAAMYKFIAVFFAIIFLMRNQIVSYWKHIIRIVSTTSISLIGIAFAIITISRFSTGIDSDFWDSVASYFGQGIANFATLLDDHPFGALPYHGSLRFPLFSSHSTSVYDLDLSFSSAVSLNAFGTTIGSWINDCGAIWTFVIAVSCNFLISLVVKMKHFTVFTLSYIVMIYQFLFMTIFFFDSMVSKYMLFSILILILLDNISRIKNGNEARS